jgi:hypothetical protein
MGIAIESLPVEVNQGELVTRYVEMGDMAIRHAQVPAGADFGPVLEGRDLGFPGGPGERVRAVLARVVRSDRARDMRSFG